MGIAYWSTVGGVGAVAVSLFAIGARCRARAREGCDTRCVPGDWGAAANTPGATRAGLVMLIIGGGAVYSNYKGNWLFLLIIMIIDVALFLWLTAVIVARALPSLRAVQRWCCCQGAPPLAPPCPPASPPTVPFRCFGEPGCAQVAFMFARGYHDPVADLVKRNWLEIFEGETQSSDANPQSVCFNYVPECQLYKKAYDILVIDVGAPDSPRSRSPPENRGRVLVRGSRLSCRRTAWAQGTPAARSAWGP